MQNKMFLDPKKPLETCTAGSCDHCLVKESVTCHFQAKHLLRFLSVAFLPFIAGGIGISRTNALAIIPWVVLALLYFGFIEIRVMCSHCPHYAEPSSKALQCWANYGSPKLWKYRPGPMSGGEKWIFITGLVLIFGYPIPWVTFAGQWIWLGIYLVLTVVFAAMLSQLMCTRCMNFACPLNRVPQNIRKGFFKQNPLIARAWNQQPDV